ncbi:MAG: hypothetical protein HY369_01225 [Candidatus Aenigmarchaeota archaeon]|nr:hypothetical protein [Candidatus Aenigmarchaeota archaeon]
MPVGTMQGMELMRQWIKVLFSILLGIAFIMVFQSWFLAIMTWTFLFFIPSADKETELAFSRGIFNWGMLLLLFFAFFQSELLGLGLQPLNFSDTIFGEGSEIGSFIGSVGPWVLLLLLLVKGLMSFAPAGKAEEPHALMWITEVLIFLFIVGLIVVLQIWNWPAETIIFIGIWAMAYVSGSAGDQESRQTIGVIMIMIAFVIFSLGIGQQAVGGALFGQWWPTLYQGISAVTAPLGQVFQDLSSLFGDAFFLITNPTGYAQAIINGSFQTDPETGLRGAFGVEILDASTSPLFAEQPYTATVKIQNKGSFEGRNILLTLRPGANAPKETGATPFADEDKATLADLGFFADPPLIECSLSACTQWVDGQEENELAKLDLRQISYNSDGVSCADVVRFDLHAKFLPLVATVTYDYEVDSTLGLEFISEAEWDRLVAEGKVKPQIKKPASLKNAPVFLNIGTLEQPIREGTTHRIDFNLLPVSTTGKIQDGIIHVEFPATLGLPKFCLPEPSRTVLEGGILGYYWEDSSVFNNNYYIACEFAGLDFAAAELAGPSHTVVIRANASYRYEESRPFLPAKLEFGGVQCCETGGECVTGYCRSDNTCGELPEGAVTGTGLGEVCSGGSGSCATTSYVYKPADADGDIVASPLTCTGIEVGESEVNVCCPDAASDAQCQKAYELRQGGETDTDVIVAAMVEL